MTKEEFVELVRLSLPLDHNPVLVEKYIAMAYSSFVRRYFNENGFQTEFFTKEYTGVTVSRNNTTEFYYSTLPAKILNVSRKGSGVWSIDVTGTPDLVFAPITDSEYKIINDLTALKVSSLVPFVVIGSRIEYRYKLLQFSEVNMRLLIQFDEYDDTDDINFPSDTELRIRDIVTQLMGQHPIKDNVVDHNEKTR